MSLASMRPDRWEEVRAALDAVRALDAAARAARLDELCGGDRALRAEVERLLAVDAYLTLTGGTRTGDGTLDYLARTPTVSELDTKALGRYRLIRLLGHGGMGSVFLADDEQLRRPVAIKMVSAGAHVRPSSVHGLREEAAAVAKLVHPNVVPIYDWGECESGPYFVMEYVAGGSLLDRMKVERLPAAEAARLVRLLARAVHAAHQRGIVHRDLKPGNILLAPPADEPALNFAWGCPKIGDFGLAVPANSMTDSRGSITGTPVYMSPEQAGGEASVGPPSDVFSLGVVFYELLTGTRPFGGTTINEVLANVRSIEPERPSRLVAVPLEIERICLKCLEKDPAKRYATAADLAEALHGATPQQIHQSRSRDGPRPPWSWRSPIKIAAWGTFAIFCVAVLGMWLTIIGPNDRIDPTAVVPPSKTPQLGQAKEELGKQQEQYMAILNAKLNPKFIEVITKMAKQEEAQLAAKGKLTGATQQVFNLEELNKRIKERPQVAELPPLHAPVARVRAEKQLDLIPLPPDGKALPPAEAARIQFTPGDRIDLLYKDRYVYTGSLVFVSAERIKLMSNPNWPERLSEYDMRGVLALQTKDGMFVIRWDVGAFVNALSSYALDEGGDTFMKQNGNPDTYLAENVKVIGVKTVNGLMSLGQRGQLIITLPLPVGPESIPAYLFQTVVTSKGVFEWNKEAKKYDFKRHETIVTEIKASNDRYWKEFQEERYRKNIEGYQPATRQLQALAPFWGFQWWWW